MNNLKVSLLNSSLDAQERSSRESMFREHILDKLHTAENVMNLREQFYMVGSSCNWTKHYRNAFNYASKGINRKEYKQWNFHIGLENDK